MRRRSRLPSDCCGALLPGAWLVNCLESGVVAGAVSKTAPLNHRLIISGLLLGGQAWAATTSRPSLAPHLAQTSEVLAHLGSTGPLPACPAGTRACPNHSPA